MKSGLYIYVPLSFLFCHFPQYRLIGVGIELRVLTVMNWLFVWRSLRVVVVMNWLFAWRNLEVVVLLEVEVEDGGIHFLKNPANNSFKDFSSRLVKGTGYISPDPRPSSFSQTLIHGNKKKIDVQGLSEFQFYSLRAKGCAWSEQRRDICCVNECCHF